MGFDDLPEGWAVKLLEEVATISAGTTAPQGTEFYQNGTIPFVRAQDVGRHGRTTGLTETADRLNEYAVSAKRLKRARKGAVLFPKSGASILTNSRAKLGVEACVVSHLAIVEADSTLLDDDFLFHWLCTFDMAEIAQSESGYPSVRLADVAALEIPIPPLAEQRRLVERIEAFTARLSAAGTERQAISEAVEQTLTAQYHRIVLGTATRPFGELAKLVRRAVGTTLEGRYAEMGIRSFGKGTFHKPVLTGAQLKNKRVFRICSGDLVFMNVFAWEGAIAVAQAEDDGRVGSHRFMTHEVNPDLATAEFLCFHFLTPHGLEDIRGASPGSAGRNRTLGIGKLREIQVPVPPIQEQRKFARLWQLRHDLRRLQRELEADLAGFTPALLARAFRGEL